VPEHYDHSWRPLPDYHDDRRLRTAVLEVGGPRYIYISTDITLVADPKADADQVVRSVRERLEMFNGLFSATENAFGHRRQWRNLQLLLDRADLPRLVAMSLLWVAIPFTLFPLAEQHVTSAVAGMLNGGLPILATLFGSLMLRRLPTRVQIVGLILGFAVIGAAYTKDINVAVAWITIAVAGISFHAPVGWSIPSLIAPHGGTATIGGIMNFFNNMMGVAAPIATGYIVSMTGSFTGAFPAAGIVLVVGIVAFVFILGPLEPVPDPSGEPTAPV